MPGDNRDGQRAGRNAESGGDPRKNDPETRASEERIRKIVEDPDLSVNDKLRSLRDMRADAWAEAATTGSDVAILRKIGRITRAIDQIKYRRTSGESGNH